MIGRCIAVRATFTRRSTRDARSLAARIAKLRASTSASLRVMALSHDKKAVAKRRTSKSREFSCSEGSRTPLTFVAREKTS
jgi:hypothetical protein